MLAIFFVKCYPLNLILHKKLLKNWGTIAVKRFGEFVVGVKGPGGFESCCLGLRIFSAFILENQNLSLLNLSLFSSFSQQDEVSIGMDVAEANPTPPICVIQTSHM